ncbi:hypothetical protein H2198_006506 [Neophaeococcomyces mojaviensis]|uniref:Uncharacterized protein n=1 Tax=Neophaeococcomyces mojaviensis TaxID=3383035 RepID=A0ACC3A307_9EURO|nr:hypothetical protein H2198_006506 [Knufia sp. JES_112]
MTITLQELQEAVVLLKKNMPKDLALFLMIDGIDEYSGDHFDFSRFLIQLCEHPAIKLLVSSRPIAECVRVFALYPNLRLQDLTSEDIRNYVEAELISDHLLHEMEILEPGLSEHIKDALVKKASGVFLWIILVVRELLIGLANYDEKHILLAKIDELPSDLEELYDHMFGKMSRRYQQEASLFFQLTRRALDVQKCPLTALQLYSANRSFIGHDPASTVMPHSAMERALRIKALEGKLRSRCCGLIEIQYHGPQGPLAEPKADYLHRTVCEYLRIGDVWDKITMLYKLSEAETDEILLASLVPVVTSASQNETKTNMQNVTDAIEACFDYGNRLSCESGDLQYMQHLEVVDTAFSRWCERASSSSVSPHERPSKSMGTFCGYESAVTESSKRESTVSLFTISKLNLPVYFKWRLGAESYDQATLSTLLLHVLSLCKSVSTTSGLFPIYIRNIRALLQRGADPNCPGKMPPGLRSIPALCSQAEAACLKSRTLTSWQYWLSVYNCLPAHIEIVNLLVTAGATFHNDAGLRQEALRTVYSSLGTHEAACSDFEEIMNIGKVLHEPSSAASTDKAKRKAQSPLVSTNLPKRHVGRQTS